MVEVGNSAPHLVRCACPLTHQINVALALDRVYSHVWHVWANLSLLSL